MDPEEGQLDDFDSLFNENETKPTTPTVTGSGYGSWLSEEKTTFKSASNTKKVNIS